MDLTGVSESSALGVYMHVCCREDGVAGFPEEGSFATLLPPAESEPEASVWRVRNSTSWLERPLPVPALG